MLFAVFCLLSIAQKRKILIVHPLFSGFFHMKRQGPYIYPTHPWIHEGKIHTNQKANSKRHKKREIEKNNCLVGWQVNFKVESKSQRKK